MAIFWKIAVFLLAASFLAESMGFLTHQMNLAVGLTCLVLFVLLYLSPAALKKPIEFKKIDRRAAVIGLVIVVVAIVLWRGDLLVRMSGLCVFLFGFDLMLRSLGRKERELSVMLVALLGFTLFIAVYQYTPFLWYGMNSLSLSLSKMVSFFVHKDVLLGTTFTGLWSTVLFAWFFISSHLFSAEKKAWQLPVFLAVVLVVNVLYVALFAYFPSFLRFLPLAGGEIEPDAPIPERHFLNLPIILFLLLLGPLYLHVRRTRYQAVNLMPKKADIRLLIPSLVLLALSIGSLTISLPVKFVADREVVFYEKGFLNWNTPTFQSFGSASAGMFGNLPSFVDKMGLKSRRTGEITKESLSGAKVLVLININEEVPQPKIDMIWDFVRDGGSLLMLGDHTWRQKDGKNWLNEILRPVNIEYNFDSADFFIGGWLHSYEYARHPITHNLGDEENEPGVVVGASLKTRYPAVPLIVGRYGYSDVGNVYDSERGYLGNFEYDMSEQVGDLILAAEQKYGKGKVLVFGDTSGFANSILINSYPFINRVFTWLASDSRPEPYPIRLVLCLVFLAGAVALFLRADRNAVTLFLGALVIALFVLSAGFVSSWKIERPITGHIAYVDSSHFGRYSKESWREDGAMGLYLNLMRNGYLPFQLRDFSAEKIADSDLLVLIAPTKPFSKGEVEMLKAYVQNGGRLILTVGWEERNASLPIVEAFNFRLHDSHLGYFKVKVPNTNEMAMFWEAWPVYSEDDKAEEICSNAAYPLINVRDYGKGKFVIIGDSNFFLNKNLETEKQPYMDNVNFLKWLLAKLAAS